MNHPFRYKKLCYLALNVTNIERSHEFVTKVYGLDYAGAGEGGERYYRVCHDHHSVVLHQAKTAGFKRAGWQLDNAEEVDKAFVHFNALGWNPQWLPEPERIPLGLQYSKVFRVREPFTGCMFEYFDRIEQTLVAYSKSVVKIERLGHFGVCAPDVIAGAAHFEQNLGFIVSDYVGKFVALMRVFGSPLHHSMGIGFAPTPHFQHINCMVTDIDDIGRAIWRLKKHNVPVSFGPGRHPTSDSIFIYFQDPDGMTWEYSYGMELFPEEGYRLARMMGTKPEDIDQWGAGPEPEFGQHGNIEGIEDDGKRAGLLG
jgi:2,3-dihydroxy-p-cumate/2,3-dihydroxybenzoate 3,4-dioxygenase